VRFITRDSPTRTPSTKLVIGNPEYSRCKKLPIRIPEAIDIMPIANMLSSLSFIPFTLSKKYGAVQDKTLPQPTNIHSCGKVIAEPT